MEVCASLKVLVDKKIEGIKILVSIVLFLLFSVVLDWQFRLSPLM